MGRELITRYDVFGKSLSDAGSYLQTLGCTWDIIGEYSLFLISSPSSLLPISRCFCILIIADEYAAH